LLLLSSTTTTPDMTEVTLAFASLPRQLWLWYLENLWSPPPGSWVRSVAYTFRVLAILLILPFACLTLLDVTSYVIARTLGVIDSTKASTNDKNALREAALAQKVAPGSDTHINSPGSGGVGRDEQFLPSSISTSTQTEEVQQGQWSFGLPGAPRPSNQMLEPESGPTAFFFSPSEGNLELSGATIFSPAVSRQGSPPIERRKRKTQREDTTSDHQTSASTSSSDNESLVLLERDPQTGEWSSSLRRRGTALADGPRQTDD